MAYIMQTKGAKDDHCFKRINRSLTSWTNRSSYADSAPSIPGGYVGSSHSPLEPGKARKLQSPPWIFVL